MANVLISAGARNGRSVTAEPALRAAIGAGDAAFTKLNGVFFAVTLKEDDSLLFTALTEAPSVG